MSPQPFSAGLGRGSIGRKPEIRPVETGPTFRSLFKPPNEANSDNAINAIAKVKGSPDAQLDSR